MNNQFIWGVAIGAGGLYLIHRYVRPLPGAKA